MGGGDAAIITIETGFSFPSGHVTSSIVLFGLFAYFVFQRSKSSNRKTLSSTFSLVIAFLVGFDRLYLDVHWLSNVLGGYLLGVFWLMFSIFVFQFLQRTTKFQMKKLLKILREQEAHYTIEMHYSEK